MFILHLQDQEYWSRYLGFIEPHLLNKRTKDGEGSTGGALFYTDQSLRLKLYLWCLISEKNKTWLFGDGPSDSGATRESPWTDHQSITGLTHTETIITTFTPTGNLQSPINPTSCVLDGGRKVLHPEETPTSTERTNSTQAPQQLGY